MRLHCVQVLLELTRQADQEKTILSLRVCELGAEGKKRSFDLSVASYLRRVSLDYCDVPGSGRGSVTSFTPSAGCLNVHAPTTDLPQDPPESLTRRLHLLLITLLFCCQAAIVSISSTHPTSRAQNC